MTSRFLPALSSTVVLGVCLFAAPSAQAINVDSAFGTGGTLFTPASETLADRYQAATNGPGGVTYQAGYVNVSATDRAFFVTKLKADGTLDATFGTGGYAIKNVVTGPWAPAPAGGSTPTGGAESAKGVAVQSDGKIVVVGLAETLQDGTAPDSRDQDLYVIRLNTDGTLDASFGANGIRRFSGSNGLPAAAAGPAPAVPTITADQSWGISVRPNDKIVLTISKGTDSADTDGRTDRDLGVLQLTANGAVDTTFGAAGVSYARTPYISEAARGNLLDANGSVVVAGYGQLGLTGGSNRPSIVRFTESGALDTTFGGDSPGTTASTQTPANFAVPGVPGVATSAFGGAIAEAYALAKSGTGYAVGAYGRSTGTTNRAMMYKFDGAGHWDQSWGEPGGLTFFVGEAADSIRDFTALSDGRLVGAGARGTDAAVFVAKADGTKDTSSSPDGVLTVDFGGTGDSFYGVRQTGPGTVTAAGYRSGGAGVSEDSAITRINVGTLPTPVPSATPAPAPAPAPTPVPTVASAPTPVVVTPKVTAPKTAKAGRSVDYKVKLSGATGKVVFSITAPGKKKATKKTVTIKAGTAKVKIKGLKAGTYKVSWSFAGDAKTKAAKGSSTIKVSKKP